MITEPRTNHAGVVMARKGFWYQVDSGVVGVEVSFPSNGSGVQSTVRASRTLLRSISRACSSAWRLSRWKSTDPSANERIS